MSITPYITVADARAAIEWYRNAFGARVSFEPIVMEDGRIGHVELTIGNDARFMMSDEFDSAGVAAPDPGRHNAVTLHVDTTAVDVVVRQAKTVGAQIDREPEDTPNGRIAVLHDPFGHRWMFNQRADDRGRATSPALARDLTANLRVPDLDGVDDFYGDYLGLTDEGFNLGWVTHRSAPGSGACVQLVTRDRTAPVDSAISVHVADVDAAYAEARRRGYRIVHPLTDEEWGVRRFFVQAPDGTVVNMVSHAD
ncbi:MAG TPA: VOC family protein [Flexivirga sp.]|uniref:VOC family protein n=1 Tax=Flexivirga sp. TaxID=1962927 RepID=UPI002D1907A7|nr:VOC family protein [Flexivirga sp.]HWC21062.1 VOC family protein [Flexivirga sp.]